jgi:hypothetical protein
LKKIILIVIVLLLVFVGVIYIRQDYNTSWLKIGDSIGNGNIQFLGGTKSLFVFENTKAGNKIERYYIPMDRKEFIISASDGNVWNIQILDRKTKPVKIKIKYQVKHKPS